MLDFIKFNTGAAAGGAGVATATGYSPPISGRIQAVHVAYLDSPPAATTDFVLSDENDPASESIVSLANGATDQKLYPRRLLETNDGADLTYDGSHKVYGEYVVHGRLKAIIAQANNGDSCDVSVWFER
jgi:hypothetical protein